MPCSAMLWSSTKVRMSAYGEEEIDVTIAARNWSMMSSGPVTASDPSPSRSMMTSVPSSSVPIGTTAGHGVGSSACAGEFVVGEGAGPVVRLVGFGPSVGELDGSVEDDGDGVAVGEEVVGAERCVAFGELAAELADGEVDAGSPVDVGSGAHDVFMLDLGRVGCRDRGAGRSSRSGFAASPVECDEESGEAEASCGEQLDRNARGRVGGRRRRLGDGGRWCCGRVAGLVGRGDDGVRRDRYGRRGCGDGGRGAGGRGIDVVAGVDGRRLEFVEVVRTRCLRRSDRVHRSLMRPAGSPLARVLRWARRRVRPLRCPRVRQPVRS